MERTFVEISRQKLIRNYEAIRQRVGDSVEVLAVVKGDAYGHGAVEVAKTLEGAGARWFGVTSTAEGAELRRNGVRGRLLVFADLGVSGLDAIAEFELAMMVHSVEQLAELDVWARRRGVSPAVHLEFDSGMGRLGIPANDAGPVADILASAPQLRVEGLATHFASAEELNSGQTEEQIQLFAQIRECLAARGIRPAHVHMANSAAVAYWPQTRGSMVRPGLALYGYMMPPRGDSNPGCEPLPVEPILTWKARVLAVKEYPSGAPLGYNASYRTERSMRVGVIAAGYADGVDRRLSNGGVVLAGGTRARIVGLVSMDVCLVDLTDAQRIRAGDYITLLGSDGGETLDAAETARHCGTIPYEILCGIAKRVKRVYL